MWLGSIHEFSPGSPVSLLVDRLWYLWTFSRHDDEKKSTAGDCPFTDSFSNLFAGTAWSPILAWGSYCAFAEDIIWCHAACTFDGKVKMDKLCRSLVGRINDIYIFQRENKAYAPWSRKAEFRCLILELELVLLTRPRISRLEISFWCPMWKAKGDTGEYMPNLQHFHKMIQLHTLPSAFES